MSKFNKCSKCWREYSMSFCPNGCDSVKPHTKKEIIQEVLQKIPVKKTKTMISKPEIISLVSWDKEPVTGLPIYTKSYIHNRLGINYHSINNKCIQYNGKYILHSDIIAWFSSYLENNSK